MFQDSCGNVNKDCACANESVKTRSAVHYEIGKHGFGTVQQNPEFST